MKHSLSTNLKNLISFVYTKLFFKGARLVRLPIFLFGKRGIIYGRGFTTGRNCRISASIKTKSLIIGENVRIGDYVHINADYSITIGENTLIASKVFITDTSHGAYKGGEQSCPNTPPNDRKLFCSAVVIGKNVWIGENVVILPGTIIGDGCVIGANAVLTGKEYKKNSLIVGIPGKTIKRFDDAKKMWVPLDTGH